MIKSMTGFGDRELELAGGGRIRVELRSSNHKFLEIVLHLPEGFLSQEERIKKAIEAKIKRGRVTCVITITGARTSPGVFVNRPLLKDYISMANQIREEFQIKDEISINTLIQLPGILSLEEQKVLGISIWPHLKSLVGRTVEDLAKTRQKEGRAMYGYLKKRAELLRAELSNIRIRFRKAIKEKTATILTDEERSAFLRDSDITEELERLAFHIRNFITGLAKNGAIGKELDFIAQEMQREANTVAAKSFDKTISGKIVQIKSLIEKIREQVQNIE